MLQKYFRLEFHSYAIYSRLQQAKSIDLGQIRDAQVARTCENLDFAILLDFNQLKCDFSA